MRKIASVIVLVSLGLALLAGAPAQAEVPLCWDVGVTSGCYAILPGGWIIIAGEGPFGLPGGNAVIDLIWSIRDSVCEFDPQNATTLCP